MKEILEQLIVNLRDKDPSIRRKAAMALGNIKDKRSVAPLIAALKDENRHVRRIASGSLEGQGASEQL